MARFRLFGRPAPVSPGSAPWIPEGTSPGYGSPRYGPPGPGWSAGPPVTHGPWTAPPDVAGPANDRGGPATRAARPARRPIRTEDVLAPDPIDDLPTDPHGFPPIGDADPSPPGFGDPPSPPHPAEAAALAGAFAVDYLSWDEDDPARRGLVLADYLPVPGGDPARLGWSGRGRQRAEFALPGLVRPDGDGRVLVDVRVRVTPYRRVGGRGDPPVEPEPEIVGIPAVAPAPSGRGWRSLASHWIRISVPIALDAGRLVVDAWEETLGEDEPPPADRADLTDPTLDDDASVAGRTGGAW
ncbi:hypothetical protein ACVGVM_02750 [Pseudonocardia bannensis]|uniref:Uncharacterized protein n=1 Tax=Pseudonocardia bannensis TaxID=630973 RepID=A0A848DL86_9PSEU|nr:hypothetical protein [Pseudonocardia bannensis]NMH93299.1 hypothetical protein [Pseudonocardia bannensis]